MTTRCLDVFSLRDSVIDGYKRLADPLPNKIAPEFVFGELRVEDARRFFRGTS